MSLRAAKLPGADNLMVRVYAAMTHKQRELISRRTTAALAAAKAHGVALGGDRGNRLTQGPGRRRGGRGATRGRAKSTPADEGDTGDAGGMWHSSGRPPLTSVASLLRRAEEPGPTRLSIG